MIVTDIINRSLKLALVTTWVKTLEVIGGLGDLNRRIKLYSLIRQMQKEAETKRRIVSNIVRPFIDRIYAIRD